MDYVVQGLIHLWVSMQHASSLDLLRVQAKSYMFIEFLKIYRNIESPVSEVECRMRHVHF
jgi:hypothetical protein